MKDETGNLVATPLDHLLRLLREESKAVEEMWKEVVLRNKKSPHIILVLMTWVGMR